MDVVEEEDEEDGSWKETILPFFFGECALLQARTYGLRASRGGADDAGRFDGIRAQPLCAQQRLHGSARLSVARAEVRSGGSVRSEARECGELHRCDLVRENAH